MTNESNETVEPTRPTASLLDLPIGEIVLQFQRMKAGDGQWDETAVARMLSMLVTHNVQQLLALVQYGREVYTGSRNTKLSACFKGMVKQFPRRNQCIPYLAELGPYAYRYLDAALAECERKHVRPEEALALDGLKQKKKQKKKDL